MEGALTHDHADDRGQDVCGLRVLRLESDAVCQGSGLMRGLVLGFLFRGSLRKFAEILLWIRLEFFDAGLAAEFDLLSVVDFGDGIAHGAEFVVGDDACCQRIGFGSSSGGACSVCTGSKSDGDHCEEDAEELLTIHCSDFHFVYFGLLFSVR